MYLYYSENLAEHIVVNDSPTCVHISVEDLIPTHILGLKEKLKPNGTTMFSTPPPCSAVTQSPSSPSSCPTRPNSSQTDSAWMKQNKETKSTNQPFCNKLISRCIYCLRLPFYIN